MCVGLCVVVCVCASVCLFLFVRACVDVHVFVCVCVYGLLMSHSANVYWNQSICVRVASPTPLSGS